ncbi:MAG: hypothetical protein H7X83_00710 [Verrucomicrobia bacterium]|nr:hypothetical protein [Deltaproteobacteria bacterium]
MDNYGKGCRVLLVAAVLMVAMVSSGRCEQQEPAAAAKERFLPLQPRSDWNSQISISLLPTSDLHGIPASVGINDYRLRLVRNVNINDKLTLSLGGGYGHKHIDASADAGLPQDLHSLYLDAGAYYKFNARSFASVKMTPGFYSDFKDLGSDDLRMPVLALGGYAFSNGMTLIGGFAYRFGYHSAQFIPALGLTYQVNDQWRIDLIAPRPGVTYSASRQLQLFVAGDFSSDEYELKDRAQGAKVIKYRDYRVLGGVDYLPTKQVKLSGAVGYAFDRDFVFYDGNRSSMRMDNVPFMRLSLDFGW